MNVTGSMGSYSSSVSFVAHIDGETVLMNAGVPASASCFRAPPTPTTAMSMSGSNHVAADTYLWLSNMYPRQLLPHRQARPFLRALTDALLEMISSDLQPADVDHWLPPHDLRRLHTRINDQSTLACVHTSRQLHWLTNSRRLPHLKPQHTPRVG